MQLPDEVRWEVEVWIEIIMSIEFQREKETVIEKSEIRK